MARAPGHRINFGERPVSSPKHGKGGADDGKKVLIVEDDSNIAELLNLYLEKEGFEPLVAKDGGKGVEQFRAFQPDLVLLDIMLPVMDGWSVLKKIRESSKVPVIMLTAKGETSDKVSGLEMGCGRLYCQAL